ncbi:MAG TPA: hypothetical protein VMZ00_05900 [Sporichthya sp.]|nr:hypothetical protein [Sporichthya sp.]
MPARLNPAGAATAGLALLALGACGGGDAATAKALPPELLNLLTSEMDCLGAPLVQVRQHRYDFTGDGVEDALVAVRCDPGAGAPPSGVFAVAARPGGPEVIDELLSPDAGEVVKDLQAVGPNAVVTSFGFGPSAPRCCPDLEVSHTYRWDGAAFADGMTRSTPLPEAPQQSKPE